MHAHAHISQKRARTFFLFDLVVVFVHVYYQIIDFFGTRFISVYTADLWTLLLELENNLHKVITDKRFRARHYEPFF